MNLIKYLRQPYPIGDSNPIFIIVGGLFVFLFAIIFQPFGLGSIEEHKILIISGYGLVTCLVLFIDFFLIVKLLPNFFNEENWTIGKQFAESIWIVFSIGLGNAVYSFSIFDYPAFDLLFFINFELYTLAIGVIPVTISILISQNKLLKKHLKLAQVLNQTIEHRKTTRENKKLITFFGDNKNESVEFDINEFLFVESSGNYIYLNLYRKNELTKLMYRCTVKRAIEHFQNIPEIAQCHRAFIVNTVKIVKAEGNSQGLRLYLKNCNIEVPVSRGFVKDVKNKII